ncbi:ABC transporter ATP-binding protein [Spiroplasma sp. DGKH1]|uniref:ABC transporter ATP-binding protein n=1 Tax=Spiroplasma sp. DGKH1 TaxID=3050074 RepID=UPI0034C6D9ED
MRQNIIEVSHLTKKFKKFIAVDDISFTVKSGTIHGFIGPNGSGKTTTIKSIIGAINPTAGKISINGFVNTDPQAKKLIGYIPESARFPKGVSLATYLTSMSYLNGNSKIATKKLITKILTALDLQKFQKKSPLQFSSGMQKKVLLAQALLNDPQILILDEPTANLDPTARLEVYADLKKLQQLGKTIVICTHILSEIQHLVEEVTILNFSKIVFSGPTNGHDLNKIYTENVLKNTSNHQNHSVVGGIYGN